MPDLRVDWTETGKVTVNLGILLTLLFFLLFEPALGFLSVMPAMAFTIAILNAVMVAMFRINRGTE